MSTKSREHIALKLPKTEYIFGGCFQADSNGQDNSQFIQTTVISTAKSYGLAEDNLFISLMPGAPMQGYKTLLVLNVSYIKDELVNLTRQECSKLADDIFIKLEKLIYTNH